MADPIIVGGTSLGLSLLISLTLTPLVRRWALKRGFVDRPGAGTHKQHARAVPFGGGIAITLAVLLPMVGVLLGAMLLAGWGAERLPWLTEHLPLWPYWAGGVIRKAPEALAIIAGALVMHLMGIIDDHRPLSPWFKLIVQTAVALLIAAGAGIRSAEFLGPIPSIVITTLWIVALTNAFNFMDNMDGLSAGVAALTATILAISAFQAGQVFVPCVLLLLAGAALGFLVYNFPPASVFMGDAGSLVIGFLLAVCTVLTTFKNVEQQVRPFGIVVPLLVFAVPLYDQASVIIRRLRLGVSPFRSDRRHFSHRLVKLGLSPTAAVLTIYLATLATALPAILVPSLSWGEAVLIFGQCVCVVVIIAILEARDEV
ncbi:MAG: undecaprenyl/decaprenyl-phosphate alpha-N-acetylglucosaminyl 1-phosphate transferase [Phycisphaerae bacterium]|nr:undecaprenyl/decaprenyl-phosphate alpha-N-acetylglucosaminyl 1-phosphate transferase [Phycisphaerae bacterium]